MIEHIPGGSMAIACLSPANCRLGKTKKRCKTTWSLDLRIWCDTTTYIYVCVYIYIYAHYIQTVAQNSKSFGVEQRESGKNQAITVTIDTSQFHVIYHHRRRHHHHHNIHNNHHQQHHGCHYQHVNNNHHHQQQHHGCHYQHVHHHHHNHHNHHTIIFSMNIAKLTFFEVCPICRQTNIFGLPFLFYIP